MIYSVETALKTFEENVKKAFYHHNPTVEVVPIDKDLVAKTFIGHGGENSWEEFAYVVLRVNNEVLYSTHPWSTHLIPGPVEAYSMIGREIILGMGESVGMSYVDRISILRVCAMAIRAHQTVGDPDNTKIASSLFDTDAYEWHRRPVYRIGIPEGYILTARARIVELDAHHRLQNLPRLGERMENNFVHVETEWVFIAKKEELDRGQLHEVDRIVNKTIRIMTSSRWKGDDMATQQDAVREFLKLTGKA